MEKKRSFGWLWEPLSDFVIFLAGSGAAKWIGGMLKTHAAPIVAEQLKNHAQIHFGHDPRGSFWDDVRKVEEKHPGETVNIRRRLAEARKENREDKDIKLICKLPLDEKDGWQPAIRWLNRMSESDYHQTLYGLENDVFPQDIQRTWEAFKKLGDSAATRAREAGTPLGSFLDNLADLAETLPGAKPRQRRAP